MRGAVVLWVAAALVGASMGALPPSSATEALQVTGTSGTSTLIRGRAVPVTVGLSITGTGPFTWTGHTSIFDGDAGRVVHLEPAPGSPALVSGPQRVKIGDTATFRAWGRYSVQLTVTDATGQSRQVDTAVTVLSTTRKPLILGTSRTPGKRTARIWGRGDRAIPGIRYRIYLRPTGARRFTAIGTAASKPNGRWTLRSARLRNGQVYAKAVAPYVVPNRSDVARVVLPVV